MIRWAIEQPKVTASIREEKAEERADDQLSGSQLPILERKGPYHPASTQYRVSNAYTSAIL